MTANQKTIKIWLNAYLPPLLWAAVIFILSSQQVLPGFTVSLMDFILKKSAHAFVYGMLYFLFARAVDMTTSPQQKKTRLFLPIFIVILYAVSDEIHQSFVPNRFGTLRDVGYDILGLLMVLLRRYKYI